MTAPAAYEPARRYPALDGLRGLAVLLVFAWHYPAREFPKYLGWTWAGVDVFFVLSGFLITGILWDSRQQNFRLRDFYLRRTLRIFPLYMGVWLLAVLLWPVMRWEWNWHYALWPAYLGNYARVRTEWNIDRLVCGPMATAWLGAHLKFQVSHFWSLCVEEQFYLVWPLLVNAVRKRETLIKICAAVVILLPLVRFALTAVLPPDAAELELLYRVTPTRMDALLLGGLIALCVRGPEQAFLRRWRGWMLWATMVTFVAVYMLRGLIWRQAFNTTNAWVNVWGVSVVDLAAAALLVELIHPGGWLGKVMSFRWLRALGTISYGFYIFHELLHALFTYLAERLWAEEIIPLTMILAFMGTTLLSWLSYRFYELPFLRLKARFTHQVHRAPQV